MLAGRVPLYQACTYEKRDQIPAAASDVETLERIDDAIQPQAELKSPLSRLPYGHVREIDPGGLPALLRQIDGVAALPHAEVSAAPGLRSRTASTSRRLGERLKVVSEALNFPSSRTRGRDRYPAGKRKA